jgi:hypothetical protein
MNTRILKTLAIQKFETSNRNKLPITKLNEQNNCWRLRIHAILFSDRELDNLAIAQLEHYITATPEELDRTVMTDNALICPASWGHEMHIVGKKTKMQHPLCKQKIDNQIQIIIS